MVVRFRGSHDVDLARSRPPVPSIGRGGASVERARGSQERDPHLWRRLLSVCAAGPALEHRQNQSPGGFNEARTRFFGGCGGGSRAIGAAIGEERLPDEAQPTLVAATRRATKPADAEPSRWRRAARPDVGGTASPA